jgi:hypothetical protein
VAARASEVLYFNKMSTQICNTRDTPCETIPGIVIAESRAGDRRQDQLESNTTTKEIAIARHSRTIKCIRLEPMAHPVQCLRIQKRISLIDRCMLQTRCHAVVMVNSGCLSDSCR